jgi:hypothetical protein
VILCLTNSNNERLSRSTFLHVKEISILLDTDTSSILLIDNKDAIKYYHILPNVPNMKVYNKDNK